MRYVLERLGDDRFNVINADADFKVGFVWLERGRYHVWANGELEIVEVKSPYDVIPALAAHYQKNPPRWEREGATRYSKFTQFGELLVERDGLDEWVACRGEFPLMHHGRQAAFPTREKAQQTADAHAREGFPNSEFIFDGYAWQPDPDPWWIYDGRIAVLRPELKARLLCQ